MKKKRRPSNRVKRLIDSYLQFKVKSHIVASTSVGKMLLLREGASMHVASTHRRPTGSPKVSGPLPTGWSSHGMDEEQEARKGQLTC